MPRKKTKQMNVKQILNLSSKQISKMSDKELRKIVTIANSAANKRIVRAEKAGLSSGVIEGAKEFGPFSVKGVQNRFQLEARFTRARMFLSAKTSTVAGIKSSQRKMYKNLVAELNKELPKGEKITVDLPGDRELQNISGLIWQQVDKLAEKKELGIDKMERYKLAYHAYQVTTRAERPIQTKQGLFKNLEKFYNKMYTKSLEDTKLSNKTGAEEKVAAIYTGVM